ncbi:glycosyltransferase family 2 protein [uncultured Eubacterium sp.]|jgi:uncharacterized glycosyltransferase RT0329|uniref:glycosyltransferase family 2 protein n=1 Tax=Eubacterium sp. TaxID=142586 RepID=UPI00261C362B|nr:glycosyltransferase family A protein [uncultured Eubacterium sp.]
MEIKQNEKGSLISIVVPIYNGGKYLKKCIKSILTQTYQKLEVVIVNDGSEDGTKKCWKNWLKKTNV